MKVLFLAALAVILVVLYFRKTASAASSNSSDDSEVPGGGSDPCLFPRICNAAGEVTGSVSDPSTGIEYPISSGVTN